MNSTEALEFALNVLRARERRLSIMAPPATQPSRTAEAIETLEALRELVADNERAVETRD